MKTASRVGDIAEHYVITWLWDQGYEVFRNSGCTGPVDIISLDKKTGEVKLIDVKSKSSAKDWGFTRDPLQKELKVQVVEFNGRTRKCRFVEHTNG